MHQVVRPGGLVAVKKSDMELTRILPAHSAVIWHRTVAHAQEGDVQMQGCVRGPILPIWLRTAGLTEIRRQTTLIERTAPVPALTRELLRSFLGWCAD